ncbi:hypothetical protein AGABI2DRAFT_146775 [Agaricus bisporus var. bisporus H97]|uniref:hypothetical protein n=1 Tax=Agaricus bisporus var. bisporus (strain H97 / ATCC MYA-4626 / FGSC 10389) TaxID=936046 RepID=UPI00029F6ED1|nr:hypothetical protein AGABI2DRAFT_146775 [Agaricus bisporus var. bisporus H97]EKV42292.1 hypothetical protein AGABI2DRAFT_146775 [Agaricus bisporus var. bisporus H97]
MFDSSAESIHFLNPDTYLNRLPPDEGVGYEILRDLTFAVGGAALWDVFAYLPTDISIVRESRFNFVIFCFIASRFFALAHIWFAAMYSAAVDMIIPLNVVYIMAALFYALSKTASSFLFLQRVLAVWHDNKWVRRTFSILWFLDLLSDISAILGGSPTYIPGTIKFRDCGVRPWASISFFCFFIYDTGVVVVITYKIWLAQKELQETRDLRWYHWLSGKALPRLSRSLLTGGMQYYLITVGVVGMTSVIMSAPTFPQVYKSFFPPTLVFLTSSMACRVFRNTKLLNASTYMETVSYWQK